MTYTQEQRLSDYQKLIAQQNWADRCDEMSSEPASPKPITIKCDTGDSMGCAETIWFPQYGLVNIYNPQHFGFAHAEGYSYESRLGMVEITPGQARLWLGHHRSK